MNSTSADRIDLDLRDAEQLPDSPGGRSPVPGLSGSSHELGGNQPLLLAPEQVWFVARGEVDLFSVALVRGEQTGRRRHVFRVPAGSLLLGLPAVRVADRERAFVAVATNGSRLTRGSRQELLAAWRDPARDDVRALVDAWVRQLCQALALGRPELPGLEPPPSGRFDLEPGKVLQATAAAVSWVWPRSGRLRLGAREQLELSGGDAPLPLAAPAWLRAEETSALEACPPDQIDPTQARRGLDQLGRLVGQVSHLLADEDDRNDLARLQRRQAAQRSTIQRACARLAATLRPVWSGSSEASDGPPNVAVDGALAPFVASCQRVGGELGLVIRPPAEAEQGGVGRDPVAAILRSSRVRSRKVALRDEWWRIDQGPLLGFTQEGGRPVALVRRGRGYLMEDQAIDSGKARPVDAAVAATLSPFAYTFYRPFPEGAIGVGRLLQFGARGCLGDMANVAVLGAVVTVLGMVPAFMTSHLFNNIIPGAQRSQLWQVTLLLFAAALANACFAVGRGISLLRVQQRMATSVQAAVWDRLMRLPLTFFRQFTAGDLATRAMSIDGIQQTLSGVTVTAILSGIFSLGNLMLMFSYSPTMTWRASTLLLVAMVVTVAATLLQRLPERAMLTLRGKTSGLVLQLLTSISKLRVAGAEARAFSQWVERFAQQRRLQFKVRTISNLLNAFNAAFPVLATVFIFMAGLPLLARPEELRELRTGDFLAFGTAFSACMSATLGACRALVDSLGAMALYDQARPILQCLPESQGGKSDPGVLTGDIEVQHAVFRYQPDGPPTLRDVSLRIRQGEFIALAGPSGSGKSTLLKLLLGFDTLESGSIFFDGQDIRGLDIQEVRRQMGVVLQNGRLIVGDIFRNIVGSGNATQDEAWEAARMAGVADDIMAMPMKMHTVVGEDASTLSGGQRQRLMIARAIVNRPRILLFDEATSALDNRTQAIVTASLERLQATRIVVAHRLSTIANADRIYVIERGRLVQQGAYDELMKQKGVFADLARRQLT